MGRTAALPRSLFGTPLGTRRGRTFLASFARHEFPHSGQGGRFARVGAYTWWVSKAAGALADLSADGDHLRVVLHRVIADVPEAERLQADIVARASAAGVKKVLFDYRKVDAHSEAVRTCMWDWAGQVAFVAMALIVANDLTRVRMNMTAVAQRVRMRAFLRDEDAQGWLDGAERRRPTTEITKI